MISTSLRSLERFLLPNACIVCGKAVPQWEPDALVCAICRVRARQLPTGCRRCGQPMPPVGPCRFCADWCDALVWVHSTFWLETETRVMVHHLKYEQCPSLGALMADLIADHARPPAPGWLIPIPTGAKRLKQRGYNQTAVIGRQLSQRWKMPLAEAALTRVRDTRTQTALTPKARLANVAGAFVARPAPGLAKSTLDSNIRMAILVDDVLTTGATLDAAAHALASAGWSSIGAVTFARALPYASRIAAQVHRAKRLFTN